VLTCGKGIYHLEFFGLVGDGIKCESVDSNSDDSDAEGSNIGHDGASSVEELKPNHAENQKPEIQGFGARMYSSRNRSVRADDSEFSKYATCYRSNIALGTLGL
jgi:hypothetical protein